MENLIFDKDELRYRKKKRSFKDYLKIVFKLFFFSLLLSVVYYLIFSFFIRTKQEKRLIVENKAIEQAYGDLIEKTEFMENVLKNLQFRDQGVYQEVFNSAPTSFVMPQNDSLSYITSESFSNITVKFAAAKLNTLEQAVDSCGILLLEIEEALKNKENNTNIPAIIPIKDFSLLQTGASLGEKVHPFYKTLVMHNGFDLLAPVGTNVLSTADGRISKVSSSLKESGKRIEIDHGDGYVTTYSHLSDILVRTGTQVKRGKVIGRVGSTGNTFAPHLHYEVIYKGEHRDPINYFFAEIGPSTYEALMKRAINTGQSLD